jgi:tetratricopeptide (TPR) repeat protein
MDLVTPVLKSALTCHRRGTLFVLLLGSLLGASTLPAFAAVPAADPSASGSTAVEGETAENFEQLMDEAQELLLSKRPIDARAKLQKALLLNPNDYRPYMLLGQYYLFDVGHFTLAYRYIRSAEDHFMKAYGRGGDLVDPSQTRQHATLLYLRAEAELNLDKYEDSLKTLDRFGALYSTDWYPGTRAWVLMKLKRLDEAIMVAQAGLLQQADPRRTYNILGILLSVKGQRELSLKAFQQAIAAEVSLGSMGQVATPLNNAGEVYRELFRDELAEASWLRSTRLPDGCDHILPSLNLSILYIDETRFFQADRVLSDFQACYAQQAEREDTEHRALLALARGKIALRTGHVDDALSSLTSAMERQQWFGKIGTNEDDVRFASVIALSQALAAKAATLKDKVHDSTAEALKDELEIPLLNVRSWWLNRQARNQGEKEMADFEDLYIRNTDTMLEYPTLGSLFRGYPVASFRKRISRMEQEDSRKGAQPYYHLYLAENLAANGEYTEALELLKKVRASFRPIDRLAMSQTIKDELLVRAALHHFWQQPTHDEIVENIRDREELYGILPAQIRYSDLSLPVTTTYLGSDPADTQELRELRDAIDRRFEEFSGELRSVPRYELRFSRNRAVTDGKQITIELFDKTRNSLRASQTGSIKPDGDGRADLLNKFIAAVFTHKVDPPAEPVPKLDLVEGILP